ncbi:Hypothetical protein PHPALM_9277 [Phytophthora palmivora]|uniref:CCHC-type domain-containing protein n=1 Tax=Phytophthora palmivora TaxID=4796 RepID=A0A2P4Y7R4_9STRA|nr:Hypothetical protein PHPALM_9277 [Phytophthora palmivora]
MMRYLACYEVKEGEWRMDDICDQSVQYQSTVGEEEERRFMRQDQLSAKLISSSLSCTLARQVMKYDYGSEMWEYLSKRYEGRENATTKLYTQRTLRQKLESASCRPGADIEIHLQYMMSLREQLAALDADMSDVWMVDLMIRSMSQQPYYEQLQTLMLLGGIQTLSTPQEAKTMIITLDKNAQVEKHIHTRRELSSEQHCGNRGKKLPATHNRTQMKQEDSHSSGEAKKPKTFRSKILHGNYMDREEGNCFACHKPGHQKQNCPQKRMLALTMKMESHSIQ